MNGVAQEGTAFESARSIAWGYDAIGQVVKADSAVSVHNRSYEYDMIGNRVKAVTAATDPLDPSATVDVTTDYNANNLNQYTAVDSFTPTHDADGNQIDAQVLPLGSSSLESCVFAWDAENRLISATVNSVTTTYHYDSQSRRIAQTTNASTALWIYDAWNPVAEYGGTGTLTKSLTWGMDLSGGMQGAGGVGGLLSVTDGTGTHYPAYDGNGNITEYLDASGSIAAHYEYDPFGNTTVATFPKAADFAHRFSTKPLDGATGLYYYGYRFYDPVTGRWPSRDPIQERGGNNLYSFVRNNGLARFDQLGLETYIYHCKKSSTATVTRKQFVFFGKSEQITYGAVGGTIEERNKKLKALARTSDYDQAAAEAIVAMALISMLENESQDQQEESECCEKSEPLTGDDDSYDPNDNGKLFDRKAPRHGVPGTPSQEEERYNPRTKELEKSFVERDQYGRETGRTDYTNHGYPDDHENPHHHRYEYGPLYQAGKETSGPGVAPGHPKP